MGCAGDSVGPGLPGGRSAPGHRAPKPPARVFAAAERWVEGCELRGLLGNTPAEAVGPGPPLPLRPVFPRERGQGVGGKVLPGPDSYLFAVITPPKSVLDDPTLTLFQVPALGRGAGAAGLAPGGEPRSGG